MARITIEDCVSKVKNRFELVIIAAQRAREIIGGAMPLVKNNNNEKDEVIALREISENLIDIDVIKQAILKRHQKHQIMTENDKLDQYDNELINEFSALQGEDSKHSVVTNMYAVEAYDEEFISETPVASKKTKPIKDQSVLEDELEEEDDELFEDEDVALENEEGKH